VLSAMPDIEAMEVVERFFELGERVVGTDHAVGIFLAGCRECLAEWEVHASARHVRFGVADRPADAERADVDSAQGATGIRQPGTRCVALSGFAHVGKPEVGEASLALPTWAK